MYGSDKIFWINRVLLPPANEVCEGYVFTGVCHSVHGGACVVAPGGGTWLLPGGHVWLLLGGMHGYSGGCAWLLWGGMHGCSGGGMCGCSGGHAWFFQLDTVNERAVRILLECILVQSILLFLDKYSVTNVLLRHILIGH